MEITIREERAADVEAIFDITRIAFEHKPFSQHTEQFVTNALRGANALTISLVAEIDGQVAGHVAFSPVTISDGTAGWYGLGPVCVLPALQKQGIGSALIRAGLSQLKSLGARGCVLLGSPAYYQRFGFANNPNLILAGVSQEYFMVLPFGENQARGSVFFHEAFLAEG